jgi:SAM-dependent methyltransferase
MIEYVREVVNEAEIIAKQQQLLPVLKVLRRLPMEDFSDLLLNMPDAEFPFLSRILPAMASEDVQRSWTGDSAYGLLRQTLAFTRILEYWHLRLTGRPIDGRSILDFGCGYGRLARIMYYFTDPQNYYAVDPWDRSIELCRQANLPGHIAISQYLPESLPFDGVKFDLIYAFSVFTHLSERAAKLAFRTLRRYIAKKGLLVVTIRPVDYWRLDHVAATVPNTLQLIAAHRNCGFAFNPHVRDRIDGDITYGDASMSLDFVRDNFKQWQILQVDRSLDDPYQLIVFVKPH